MRLKTYTMAMACMLVLLAFGDIVKSSNGAQKILNNKTDVAMHTSADYVQDGIVSMWDGIENAGWGIHEDNPEYWIDLVGQDSIRWYGSQSSAYDVWFCDDALQAMQYWSSSKSQSLYSAIVGSDRTMEVVFTKTYDGNCVGFSDMTGNWMSIAGFVGSRLLLYHQGTGFYVNPPKEKAPFCMSVSLVVKQSICLCYVNGAYVCTIQPSTVSAPSNSRLFLGVNLNLVNNSSYFAIKTHSIRVYSRALDSNEVRANYKIDRRRFGL